jgi:hypothetical protein
MWLNCSNRCGSKLFRALFAEVDLDSDGNYQDHRITQAGYLCLNCGAPAFDLGQVPAEMAVDEAEEVAPRVDVLCPVCETLVAVSPGAECPNCHAPLELIT